MPVSNDTTAYGSLVTGTGKSKASSPKLSTYRHGDRQNPYATEDPLLLCWLEELEKLSRLFVVSSEDLQRCLTVLETMSGLARRLYRREVTARLNQIRDEQAREAVRYDAGQARLASVGVAQLPDRTTTTDGDSSQSLA